MYFTWGFPSEVTLTLKLRTNAVVKSLGNTASQRYNYRLLAWKQAGRAFVESRTHYATAFRLLKEPITVVVLATDQKVAAAVLERIC
jgi:L-aminopeptidase/D-esterase-like protein